MKNWTLAFLLGLAAIVFHSCSTEVNTNADYDSRTVVFGILDATQPTQIIKINKTFLGTGNNLDYALIRDSSEYADDAFEAKVQQINNSNNVQQEWTLEPIVVDNKEQEPGDIFYAPEQKVYTFTQPNQNADGFYLDVERTYRLQITFPNGDVVEASTDMVGLDPGNIQTPTAFPPENETGTSLVTLVQSISGSNVNYKSQNFKFTKAEGGKRYESVLRFSFREDVYADASQSGSPVSSSDTFIDIPLPLEVADEQATNQSFTLVLEGEDFYKYLQNNLTADPKVRRVIGYEHNTTMRCFDFLVTAASSDFHTYLEVNEPVSGITTDRPTFTNVSATNGRPNLGIFGSKSTAAALNVTTNNATLTELYNGVYTAPLNFCVDGDEFLQYQGAAFSCD